jgi:hypothetical protein
MSVIPMSPEAEVPVSEPVETLDPTSLTDEQLSEIISGPEVTEEVPEEKAPEVPEQPEPQAEVAKYQKMVQDSQSMIGKQANEIGTLRKQVAELSARVNPPAPKVQPDEFFQNPTEATKKIVREVQEEVNSEAETHRTAVIEARTQSAHFISGVVPNVMDLIPEMKEVALSDGIPADRVEAFAQDILSESPLIVVQLARRAEQLKRVRELETENKQLKQKPGQMLKRIEQATKAKPSVSSVSGRTDAQLGDSEMDRKSIASMSDAELDILIKRK